MAGIGRYGKAERGQPLARDADIGDRHDEMVERAWRHEQAFQGGSPAFRTFGGWGSRAGMRAAELGCAGRRARSSAIPAARRALARIPGSLISRRDDLLQYPRKTIAPSPAL